jgi:hypothetical protein
MGDCGVLDDETKATDSGVVRDVVAVCGAGGTAQAMTRHAGEKNRITGWVRVVKELVASSYAIIGCN